MAYETIDRFDERWAHPEVAETGTWTIKPGFDLATFGKEDPEASEAARAAFREGMRDMALGIDPSVDYADYQTEHGCPEEPDAPSCHVMVATPKDVAEDERLPLVFSVTGGGLTSAGTAEYGIFTHRYSVAAGNLRVIQLFFEYRIGTGHKYPKAVNDIHAVYEWALEHADDLHVDTDRIVIFGGSTGAHLALCAAFRLKRYNWCGGPMPRGVVANIPAIGDVFFAESLRYSMVDPETGLNANWDGPIAQAAHRCYLGEHFGELGLSPEAVPTRATVEDFKGYPPVWFPFVGESEPGRDLVLDLASKLFRAQVFCDLHVWGGCNHTSVSNPMVVPSLEGLSFEARNNTVITGALNDAITYDFRRQWLWK